MKYILGHRNTLWKEERNGGKIFLDGRDTHPPSLPPAVVPWARAWEGARAVLQNTELLRGFRSAWMTTLSEENIKGISYHLSTYLWGKG